MRKINVLSLFENKRFFCGVSIISSASSSSKKGLPEERELLIKEANQLKAVNGLDYFARTCLSEVTAKSQTNVVFDSVRHPAEIQCLKENGVRFIGIDVSLETRFDRIQDRQHQTDNVNLAQFKDQDNRERKGISAGQSIDQALNECDITIYNDKNLDHFYGEIDRALTVLFGESYNA